MGFAEKFRLGSKRLKDWDYSRAGFYYVTICTQNREHIFGEIRNGKMVLNKFGGIVKTEWFRTTKIRHNVKLDAFVVMPNHLHGIVIIDNFSESKNVETHCGVGVETHYGVDVETHYGVDVETHCNAFLHHNAFLRKQNYKNKFGPQSNNLSAIIRGFKSATTKQIHQTTPALDRVWQPRFYDHIIRDADELNRIRDYIVKNPLNWENRKENLK